MRMVIYPTVCGLLFCCLLLIPRAEAGCFYQLGIRLCNWESSNIPDIFTIAEEFREEVLEPLRDMVQEVGCADSHNDRKERLMDHPSVEMVSGVSGIYQGNPVYFVNGILKTPETTREGAAELSKLIGGPVGLIYNPSSLIGDTGTPAAVLELYDSVLSHVLSSIIFGEPSVMPSVILGDLKEAGYDRVWSAWGFHCRRQFNPTTRQVTGLIYAAAETASRPITIVSHSQGNIIVRNAILGAMYLGKEAWMRTYLTWIITAPPLTRRETDVATSKQSVRVLHPNDCIALVTDLGGGGKDLACNLLPLTESAMITHDFIKTYIPLITPYKAIMTGDASIPPPSIEERLKNIPPGDTLVLQTGDYPETLTINQRVRLESQGGSARIGVSR